MSLKRFRAKHLDSQSYNQVGSKWPRCINSSVTIQLTIDDRQTLWIPKPYMFAQIMLTALQFKILLRFILFIPRFLGYLLLTGLVYALEFVEIILLLSYLIVYIIRLVWYYCMEMLDFILTMLLTGGVCYFLVTARYFAQCYRH